MSNSVFTIDQLQKSQHKQEWTTYSHSSRRTARSINRRLHFTENTVFWLFSLQLSTKYCFVLTFAQKLCAILLLFADTSCPIHSGDLDRKLCCPGADIQCDCLVMIERVDGVYQIPSWLGGLGLGERRKLFQRGRLGRCFMHIFVRFYVRF